MIPSRAPGVVLPSPSAQLPPPLLALAHCNVQTLAALSCHALSSVLSCALVVLWPSVHTSCSSLVLGPHALASLSHLPSHAVMLVSRYAASATCTTVHTYSWCNMYHVENDVDLLHEPPLKTVCEVRLQPIRSMLLWLAEGRATTDLYCRVSCPRVLSPNANNPPAIKTDNW